MDTICLQCGDRGFDNAFVDCVKCLNFSVHRYCLDVIPKTVNEYVRWVCDDCEMEPPQSRNVVSKSIEGFSGVEQKKNDLPVVQMEDHVHKDGLEKSASEVTLMQLAGKNDKPATVLPANERKKRQQSSKKYKRKKTNWTPIKRKRRRRLIKESGMEKDQHKVGNTSSEKSYEKRRKTDIDELSELPEFLTTRAPRSQSMPLLLARPSRVKDNKVSKHRDRKCKLFDSDTNLGTAKRTLTSCNGPLGSCSKKKRIVSTRPSMENKGIKSKNQFADKSSEERTISPSNEQIENGESVVRQETTCAPRRGSNFDEDFAKDFGVSSAEPVAMPIWRGSFDIRNKKCDKFDGLVAHMSSKACGKVYEAACQFQHVLQLEMCLKSDIWPKSFETSEPSGDNIALYFFPSETSERVFDDLVEKMMRKELGLKASVQNAELLIFTSTELPLLYWRFQGKYYLWGVFRGNQRTPLELPNADGLSLGNVHVTMKRCGARSPLSPLSNSASCGSGTF